MIKEIKREIKTYYGIEYAIALIGEDEWEPTDPEEKNPNQWWVLEYTKQSDRLARWGGGKGFLLASTQDQKEARMKDKYHLCELRAVTDINWLLSKYYPTAIPYVWNELKCFAYTSVRILPRTIQFAIKKIIGTQA